MKCSQFLVLSIAQNLHFLLFLFSVSLISFCRKICLYESLLLVFFFNAHALVLWNVENITAQCSLHGNSMEQSHAPVCIFEVHWENGSIKWVLDACLSLWIQMNLCVVTSHTSRGVSQSLTDITPTPSSLIVFNPISEWSRHESLLQRMCHSTRSAEATLMADFGASSQWIMQWLSGMLN